MNVHFICRGNVLRSLIAETYLKSLNMDNINVISSGTNVDWGDPQEQEYFSNTIDVLNRHTIDSYAKSRPDQLTQVRLDSHSDVVVLMNNRVANEARRLVEFPGKVHDWMIIDIGEGNRTNIKKREQYEEAIYQEITLKIDELFIPDEKQSITS